MTTLTRAVLKPLHHQVTVSQLSQLAKILVVAEKIIYGLAGTTVLLVIVQFAYPANRTLPLQKIGSVRVGFKTTDELQTTANIYDKHDITLAVSGTTFTIAASQAGVHINTVGLSQTLRSYSWRQRLIPGSLFKNRVPAKIPTFLDVKSATVFAQMVVSKAQIGAKDASATRQADGTYVLAKQVTGQSLTTGTVLTALSEVDPLINTRAVLNPTLENPAITDTTVSAAIQQYDHIRSTPITLSYDNKTYTITPQLLTGWASISVDTDKGAASVSLNQAAVRHWLSSTVPLVLQAPGTSTITTVDGVIQSKTTAASGTGIDLDATVAAISTAVQKSQASVTAPVKTLSPQERYVRQYTPSSAGLQALINDWSHSYSGLRAGVALQELGGQNRSASLNSTIQYSTASIYKLFVTWYAYNHAENGSLDLDDASPVAGKTYRDCIQAAIVVSDNPCGEGLGNHFGWANVNNFAHLGGYSHVDLANNVTAAPGDTAKLLVNLYNGSLMDADDTQDMLSYMGQQIYRSGIPAGSPGATVEDKVGIDPGIWNDAAIVKGARSTYVLVVYTNGNVGAIKNLASQIYTLMQE